MLKEHISTYAIMPSLTRLFLFTEMHIINIMFFDATAAIIKCDVK